VQVDFLLGDDFLHFSEDLSNGSEDGYADLFELLSFHGVVEIVFFHKVFQTKIVLHIPRQDLPLFLDNLHQFHICLLAFSQIAAPGTLLEDSSVKFKKMVVDVSAADVPAVLLLQDIHLGTCETADEGAQF
jgi:hypothetical protein